MDCPEHSQVDMKPPFTYVCTVSEAFRADESRLRNQSEAGFDVFEFIGERFRQILFASWQHFSLVAQCLILATIIAVVIAALVYRNKSLSSLANGVSAIGLTIPSFAAIGLLIAPFGFGVTPAVIVVTFFAALPIVRNAIVGLAGISPSVVESARGIGMSRMRTLATVELPMAWPVILSGIRVSAQMVMGVAAIAAYALGPGLGGFIFSGLSRLGGAKAFDSVLVGVIGVVILAFILDLILLGIGRLTTPRGIRV
jgi:osmoprotectant transport system permease protein